MPSKADSEDTNGVTKGRQVFNPADVGMGLVCGCGHSGTTLIATILSVHSSVYVPLYETKAFLGTERRARARLEELRSAAAEAGKTIVIEKTPRHVRHLDSIRKLVPGARFVLLVRDGRDVVASIAARANGDFESGLQRWIRDNSIVLHERDSPDVLLMRYEDVVVDPPGQLRSLCDFLGIEFSEDLLAHHRAPRLWKGRVAAHNELRNRQVNQPIFDGRGRWMHELPPEVADRFTSGEAGKLMRAFGYATLEGLDVEAH